MASLGGRFDQDVNLGGDGPTELSSIDGTATGGHDQGLRMVFRKGLDFGQSQGGLGQIVQPELDE